MIQSWERKDKVADVKPQDFEQVDMGVYKCESATVVWGNRTDILATCWEESAGYGYNEQVVIQCTKQINICLKWIEEHREHIFKNISEKSLFQLEYSLKRSDRNLRQIQIEVDVQDQIPQELAACMYIDADPCFQGHCHCMEVIVLAKEDGTYQVDVIEDFQRLLLELRDASKENGARACEWAKTKGIFYAFDGEGNMLAVVRQQFCVSQSGVSREHKLIAETGGGRTKTEREALYFIHAALKLEKYNASSWTGIPMPFGFATKELVCRENVFTITSSGHEKVSGAFYVMQEALTMIEMLYYSRGVTEEEINQCYYTFLVQDHRKYLERIYELQDRI